MLPVLRVRWVGCAVMFRGNVSEQEGGGVDAEVEADGEAAEAVRD